MKRRKKLHTMLRSLIDEPDIEGMLKDESKKNSKVLYCIVIVCFFVLEVINFFSISNVKEFIAGCVTLAVLVLLFFCPKGTPRKWALRIYIPLLMVLLLLTSIMQKPFFGLFADNNDPQAYYDDFSKGLYEYASGNYDKALSEYSKLKRTVPENETMNFYFWYMDAAIRANDLKLYTQLCKEVVDKIPNPTAEENRFLFQSIPIANLVATYNEGNFDKLLDDLSPYQHTNEKIFTLFELAAQTGAENSENQNSTIESLLLCLPNCADSFDNFDYVKKSLLLQIFYDLFEASHLDSSTVALSELYSTDPAFFFDTFLKVYPEQNNFLNVRWISLDNLQGMRNLFQEGWTQLHEDGNQLYPVYKESVINLGLFLGVADVLSEIEEGFDGLQFDKILKSYSEHAAVYNILPLHNGKYLFIILEDEFFAEGKTDLPSMATQAYFYILDPASSFPVKPIVIDGNQLQLPVIMGKLLMVQKLDNSHMCLIVCIAGSGEFLSLWAYDAENGSLSPLSVDEGETYHCSNFFYNAKTQHCNWNFEINNDFDPNMQTKVGGTVDAVIDPSSLIMDTQISYADPALQLYVEERNEQLIFPLANLNRLAGREIKDEVLLDLIRNNCMPYYHYSQIQDTFSYISEVYAPDISGLMITYNLEETGTSSETSYFFLVKRKDEEIQILGIYKITDRGLKDVYANSLISKLFN